MPYQSIRPNLMLNLHSAFWHRLFLLNLPDHALRVWSAYLIGAAAGLALLLGTATAARAQEAASFDILEYRIAGNSLLVAESIEQAVLAFMGENRTLKDVESARTALEKRYHDAGYLTVLVSIPEQSVDSGVVDLQVIEATVSKLRVVGSQYHLPSVIKAQIEQVAEGTVPNFVALQKSLSEVNRAADIKVAPVLKPGKVPGTVEVQLDVDDQFPLHGSIELTNRQSPNTTAARLGASVRYDNLWQRGHSIGLTLQTSPQNTQETKVVALNYMWPMDRTGDALTLYAVKSNSQFATLYNSPGLGLLGNTQIAGLRYALLLDSTPDYVQSMTAGVDHKDVQQTLNLSGLSADSPRVRYAPVSLSYRGVWANDQPQPTTLDISAILGLRGLLGNRDTTFGAKRLGASANFTALRSTLQSFRDVGGWSLASKLDGQLASGPLLPSEQFVGGGADSVRGYLEGERSGDQAARVSFELSGPAVKVQMFKTDWRLTALTFFDAARLLVKQPGVGQSAATSLAGAGAGLRLSAPRGIGLQLDAARALTGGDVAGGGTRKGDWRMHARLSMEF